MAPSDDEWSGRHEAFGTVEEVVADAMIKAEPWTLIRVEDEDGNASVFLVSHWLEA